MELLVLLLSIMIIILVILAYQYWILHQRYQLLDRRVDEMARHRFESWRDQEIQKIRKEEQELARRTAQLELREWKEQEEAQIRQDAVQKSQSVILGKVTEHFVPYLPNFKYNPKDARFIGSPIDFIIFDGISTGELQRVVFVEVKTGESGLHPRQRSIREAIRTGRVEWCEVRLPRTAPELASIDKIQLR